MKYMFIVVCLVSSIVMQASFDRERSPRIFKSIRVPFICKSSEKFIFETWCKVQSLDPRDIHTKYAFADQNSLRKFDLPDRKDLIVTEHSIIRHNPYEAFLSEVMKKELLIDHKIQKDHANKGRAILGIPLFLRASDYMKHQREYGLSGTVTLTKDGRDICARLLCQHKKPELFLDEFARTQKLSPFCVKDIAKLIIDRNARMEKTQLK